MTLCTRHVALTIPFNPLVLTPFYRFGSQGHMDQGALIHPNPILLPQHHLTAILTGMLKVQSTLLNLRKEEGRAQLPLTLLRLAFGPAHCVEGLTSQLSGWEVEG